MTNTQLVQHVSSLAQQMESQQTAVSHPTFLQRLDDGQSKMAAYFIGEAQAASDVEYTDLLDLTQKLKATFKGEELADLAFELNVPYEDLEGQGDRGKVRELVTYMSRRGQLEKLVTHCQALRPKLNWQLKSSKQAGVPIVSKVDVAVVIDVARPILPSVAQYLDNREIPANFVVCRHVSPGTFFSVNDNWQQLAITFSTVMGQVQQQYAGAQIHFFMAGPGALLFTMGAIWGTVHDALVYHYENNTFHPVLNTSRDLRMVQGGW